MPRPFDSDARDGPMLSGWLVINYGWRWIFCINVPVGLVSFLGDPFWRVQTLLILFVLALPASSAEN